MTKEDARGKLKALLRGCYDNDSFVEYGTGILRDEESMDTALRFAEKAREVGNELTHDDFVSLAYVIRMRAERQSRSKSSVPKPVDSSGCHLQRVGAGIELPECGRTLCECCQRDPKSARLEVTLTTFRKYFYESPQVAALRAPMLWRM